MLEGTVVVLLAIALGASLQSAAPGEEARVVRQLRSEGPGGAAAAETAIITWIGRDRIRVDEGAARTLLLRPAEGTAAVLDHAARTWRESRFAEGAQVPAPTPRGTLRSLAVTATGETRTIEGFTCRKYLAVGAVPLGNAAPARQREWEIWASEEAGASAGVRALAALLGVPLFPDSAALAEELGRIRGLPVRHAERTTLLGRAEERTTALRSVETRTVPPETWEIPEGYTRTGP